MKTPHVSKSWAVTLLFAVLAAGLPIIDAPLEKRYGIVITEQELAHFLTLFGVSGGLGAGNALRKNIAAKREAGAFDASVSRYETSGAGNYNAQNFTSSGATAADDDLIDLMPDTPPPERK